MLVRLKESDWPRVTQGASYHSGNSNLNLLDLSSTFCLLHYADCFVSQDFLFLSYIFKILFSHFNFKFFCIAPSHLSRTRVIGVLIFSPVSLALSIIFWTDNGKTDGLSNMAKRVRCQGCPQADQLLWRRESPFMMYSVLQGRTERESKCSKHQSIM